MANQRLGDKAWKESPNALVVLTIQRALLSVGVSVGSQFGIVGVLLQKDRRGYLHLKNACASTGVVGITFTILSVVIQASLL